MGSNSGPKYHTSHASGIEIIPNQTKLEVTISSFPPLAVLQSVVVR